MTKTEKWVVYGGIAIVGFMLINDYLKKRRAVIADTERAAIVKNMKPK